MDVAHRGERDAGVEQPDIAGEVGAGICLAPEWRARRWFSDGAGGGGEAASQSSENRQEPPSAPPSRAPAMPRRPRKHERTRKTKKRSSINNLKLSSDIRGNEQSRSIKHWLTWIKYIQRA